MEQPTEGVYLKSEEKMMALFSHLSLFVAGIILPIVFWIINKDKSKFATFHALQALFFQIAYLIMTFVIIFFFLLAGIGFGFISSAAKHGGAGEPGAAFFVIFIAFYAFLFVYIFGCIGYAVYMGIKAYNGEYKKYPIIGNLVYKHVFNVNN